mgnify:CR=1 FL=1
MITTKRLTWQYKEGALLIAERKLGKETCLKCPHVLPSGGSTGSKTASGLGSASAGLLCNSFSFCWRACCLCLRCAFFALDTIKNELYPPAHVLLTILSNGSSLKCLILLLGIYLRADFCFLLILLLSFWIWIPSALLTNSEGCMLHQLHIRPPISTRKRGEISWRHSQA